MLDHTIENDIDPHGLFAQDQGEDPRDFVIRSQSSESLGVDLEIPTLKNPQLFEFHQNDHATLFTRGMCTGVAPCGALSTLRGEKLDTATEIRYLTARYNLPDFDKENGGGFNKAGVDSIRKSHNAENPERKIDSFQIPKSDPLVMEALAKGHRIMAGYFGNASVGIDYSEDARLDNCASWGRKTYGHFTTYAQTEGKIHIVDSYRGRKGKGGILTNQYEIADFAALLKNPNFHANVFLYLYQDALTDSQRLRLLAKKLLIWNSEGENRPCTRYEAATMIERTLKALNTALPILPIWTGENPDGKLERRDLAVMIDRAFRFSDFSWSRMNDPATRGEVAELCAKVVTSRLMK